THCPRNGVVKALSTAPSISIVDVNTRMLHCSVALPLQRSYFSCAEFATCSRSAALRGGPFMLFESTRQGAGAAAQRTSMSAYFTNSLTAPTGLGLLGVAPRRISFGRAARGSVAPRKMACRTAAGGRIRRFKAINSRTEEGAAWSLPLSNREREW